MSAKGRARGRGAVDTVTAPMFDTADAAPAKDTRDTGEEFFPTPREAILPLLETDLLSLPGGRWIEPCAGSGRINSTVNEHRDDVVWTLCEIDPRHEPALARTVRKNVDLLLPWGDFVHGEWWWVRAAVCCMNPPFSLALQFVQAAFERADWVVMLQRTNWLAPARAPWLRLHMPDVYQLAKRPSFTPDGKTDSTEYAWFVWPPDGRDRRVGRVAMLDLARGGQLDLLTGGG